MTEEWPIAAPAEAAADRPVDGALRRGGRRLATVATDFFLDPAERLTEQERALMTAMLHGLVDTIADELRVRLPDDMAKACDVAGAALVAELSHAGLLQSEPLMSVLLRRADGSGVAQATGGQGGRALLQQWAADADGDVAAAAMALILGRTRAKDRFGRPTLGLGDLPQREAERLCHGIAAALARRCSGPAEVALADAAQELLRSHSDDQCLEALEQRLVGALRAAGRLDNELLIVLLEAGAVGLLSQVLAHLGAIRAEDAWDLLLGREESFALLLRLASLPRATAATLIGRAESALGLGDPIAAIERFDAISEVQASAERRRLALPLPFRQAQERLGRDG